MNMNRLNDPPAVDSRPAELPPEAAVGRPAAGMLAGGRGVLAAVACLTVVAVAAAGYLAGRAVPQHRDSGLPGFPMIDASTSATSEKYSIATGLVSEDSEGFFVLDHSTGILQCHVYSPRADTFAASFTANVGETLGGGAKGGGYLLATGLTDMTRGGRGAALAPSLVYVLNTGTGNYAAFAIPFDRQAAAAGRPQQGVLIPRGVGSASVLPRR